MNNIRNILETEYISWLRHHKDKEGVGLGLLNRNRGKNRAGPNNKA